MGHYSQRYRIANMLARFIAFPTLVICLLWLNASTAANSLLQHPSPYLAMHTDDPVNWQSWNDAVLKQAREENKLIFVSIGYFACHWCHVMQRETYQDETVAEILNQHFIPVKVDRELRPELDRRLIDFVVRLRGTAGWPLNVFLTPDAYPVTGFTYLPTDRFSAVILQLQQQWLTRRAEVNQAAQTFHLASIADDESELLTDLPQINSEQLAQGFVSQAMAVADELQGGFGETSKFPQHPQLSSIIALVNSGLPVSDEVIDFIHLSLRAMAGRHLIDHLNGGFFRYTTDPDWQTPHYEKMLYDNAQMVLLYLQAERLWPARGYAEVAMDTLDFILASMQHPGGGYVSSLSAVDEENREGGGYLWIHDELASHLGESDYRYISDIWELKATDEPFLLQTLEGPLAKGDADRNQKIKTRLLAVEKNRMPIDEKRLASWNALVLQALVSASAYNGKYRVGAAALYGFMQKRFFSNGQLLRFADHQSLAETTFEDYATLASAFSQYGRMTGNKQAVDKARQLLVEAHRLFYRNGKWITDESSLLPGTSGRWLLQDGVVTSALTHWLAAALEITKLPPQLKHDVNGLLYRIERQMVDTPYYYGSLIALRYGQNK